MFFSLLKSNLDKENINTGGNLVNHRSKDDVEASIFSLAVAISRESWILSTFFTLNEQCLEYKAF